MWPSWTTVSINGSETPENEVIARHKWEGWVPKRMCWILLALKDTSLHLILHYSTIVLLHSTWLDIFLTWLSFTSLDSTLLYQGSTSFYLALHYSTTVLLRSTWLYIILPYFYFTLHYSTMAVHHYTWPCNTTMAQQFFQLNSRLL